MIDIFQMRLRLLDRCSQGTISDDVVALRLGDGKDVMEPFEIHFRAAADDIDELNHVNNIVYLRWVQAAAVAHWQAVASADAQRETVWVVVRHEIDYKSPAFADEVVTVRTWVGRAEGLLFERHTEIIRGEDQHLLARARTLWCPIGTETGRPKRIDRKLRTQFSSNTT